MLTMLRTSRHVCADSPSRYTLSNLYFSRHCTLSFSIAFRHDLKSNSPPNLRIPKLKSFRPENFSPFRPYADSFHLKAYESEGAIRKDVVSDFNFDSLLSLVELSCLLSSAIVSIGFAVNSVIVSSKNGFLVAIGNRVLLLGIFILMIGVISGAWIRRRQWKRICKETVKGGSEVNLLERIEKLEEDLRNSATVIRVLSRQLEKLGIRFRITRQALKDPITETAALVQKNSEATRALAVQSDILEKELGEIQKVLLAMQEQQQKQLDLILAIGKAGKLWESKRESSEEQDRLETPNSVVDEVIQKEVHQI